MALAHQGQQFVLENALTNSLPDLCTTIP